MLGTYFLMLRTELKDRKTCNIQQDSNQLPSDFNSCMLNMQGRSKIVFENFVLMFKTAKNFDVLILQTRKQEGKQNTVDSIILY
jgi:uridine kinase